MYENQQMTTNCKKKRNEVTPLIETLLKNATITAATTADGC